MVRHHIRINLHQPIGGSVATIRPFLNCKARVRIFESEGADNIQILFVEEVATAACNGIRVMNLNYFSCGLYPHLARADGLQHYVTLQNLHMRRAAQIVGALRLRSFLFGPKLPR